MMFYYWICWQVQASAMGMDRSRLRYLNGITLKIIGSIRYNIDVAYGLHYEGRVPVVAYLETVDRYRGL